MFQGKTLYDIMAEMIRILLVHNLYQIFSVYLYSFDVFVNTLLPVLQQVHVISHKKNVLPFYVNQKAFAFVVPALSPVLCIVVEAM